MWSQLRIGMKSCSAMLAPPVWRERLVTTCAGSSSAVKYSEAILGRRMLAADDVAREGAIIQDERTSYACAPHRIPALPLISPCVFDGSHAPGYMHPRTPLFR